MDVVSWPALLTGATVGAYWARVLRLVLKFRRTTGRAANFVPPETLGRVLRFIWYPAVLLWIMLPIYSAVATDPPRALQLIYQNSVVHWLGAIAAAGALGLTTVCWKRMGKSWRMGIDPHEKTQLVMSGPYAYVRHPIYALSSLLMVASVVAVPSPAMIVLAVIHIIFLHWEARREERHLLTLHGEEYGTYMRRVGRFVPRSLAGYHGAS